MATPHGFGALVAAASSATLDDNGSSSSSDPTSMAAALLGLSSAPVASQPKRPDGGSSAPLETTKTDVDAPLNSNTSKPTSKAAVAKEETRTDVDAPLNSISSNLKTAPLDSSTAPAVATQPKTVVVQPKRTDNGSSNPTSTKAAPLETKTAGTLRGVRMLASGRWQAQLWHAGKTRYLGSFETKKEAALAYEIAREREGALAYEIARENGTTAKEGRIYVDDNGKEKGAKTESPPNNKGKKEDPPPPPQEKSEKSQRVEEKETQISSATSKADNESVHEKHGTYPSVDVPNSCNPKAAVASLDSSTAPAVATRPARTDSPPGPYCFTIQNPKGIDGGIHMDDLIPGPFDVLCGRDKKSFNHEGNKKFRLVVQSYLEGYQNTKLRSDKASIADRIGNTVIQNGGRFLRLDDQSGVYFPLNPRGIREKITHALRDACKQLMDTEAKRLEHSLLNFPEKNMENKKRPAPDAAHHQCLIQAREMAIRNARQAAVMYKQDRHERMVSRFKINAAKQDTIIDVDRPEDPGPVNADKSSIMVNNAPSNVEQDAIDVDQLEDLGPDELALAVSVLNQRIAGQDDSNTAVQEACKRAMEKEATTLTRRSSFAQFCAQRSEALARRSSSFAQFCAQRNDAPKVRVPGGIPTPGQQQHAAADAQAQDNSSRRRNSGVPVPGQQPASPGQKGCPIAVDSLDDENEDDSRRRNRGKPNPDVRYDEDGQHIIGGSEHSSPSQVGNHPAIMGIPGIPTGFDALPRGNPARCQAIERALRQKEGLGVPSLGPGTLKEKFGAQSMSLPMEARPLGPGAAPMRPGVTTISPVGPPMSPGGPPMGPGLVQGGPSMGPGAPFLGTGGPSMGPGAQSIQQRAQSMRPGATPMSPGGPSMGPGLVQGGPSMGPGGPSMGPGLVQGGPSMGPGGPSMGPGMVQGGPSMGPGGPSMGLGAPSMGPGAPFLRTGGPSMGPGAPFLGTGGPPMKPGAQPMGPGVPSLGSGLPTSGPGAPPPQEQLRMLTNMLRKQEQEIQKLKTTLWDVASAGTAKDQELKKLRDELAVKDQALKTATTNDQEIQQLKLALWDVSSAGAAREQELAKLRDELAVKDRALQTVKRNDMEDPPEDPPSG